MLTIPLTDFANASDETSADAPTHSVGVGMPLSLLSGTLYAVGATIVSFATKSQASGSSGWTRNWVWCFSAVSWMMMCSGGLCVTFAYQSGASVPLMNAIAFSTNSFLNMLFQLYFRLSEYTKTMRCGTSLFALAALLVGDLSPIPQQVSLHLLTRPQAVAYAVAFCALWIFSTAMVICGRKLPGCSSRKIMAWALHVACWGSFTDNWAKINGTFDPSSGVLYWVLFVPYLPVGAFVMLLSVVAMAATDVALYVPTNLCLQLILNVLSALCLWDEGSRVERVMPWLVGYMICVLATYIATPEMDVVASLKKARELQSRRLSKQIARTSFGKSLLFLVKKWGRSFASEEEAEEETRQALEQTLLSGLDGMVFSKEQLVDLTLRLWRREGQQYRPSAETVAWLRDIPFFQDYLAKDRDFDGVLAGTVSENERGAMLHP